MLSRAEWFMIRTRLIYINKLREYIYTDALKKTYTKIPTRPTL